MSIIVTLLLVASIAINVWFLRRSASSKTEKQSVRSTLLQGIKNVRELTTLRQHFQSVVVFKDCKKKFGISVPGTGRKFILKYGGVITCGNDLENIKITERFAVNSIRIIVPGSKILDLYADMESIQVYDQRVGIFTSLKLDDQNREIVKNLEEMRQDAVHGDILRRANENTRAVLTSFAASLGMEAEVIFDDYDAQTETKTSVTATQEPIMVAAAESEAVKAASDCESTCDESESIFGP